MHVDLYYNSAMNFYIYRLLNSVCVDSLHVYKQHTSLAENKDQETDINKVGITIYRYKSCHDRGCGPNYCCCTGPQN